MSNLQTTSEPDNSSEMFQNNEELELLDIISQNQYFQKMQNYTIFTTFKDYEKLTKGPQITIDGKKVSIEFLTRLIIDDVYYDYVSRFFRKEIKNFMLTYPVNRDLGKILKYSKLTIFKGLEQLIISDNIPITSKVLERFETLKENISFEKFQKSTQNELYEITIENQKYFVPIKKILSIMSMTNNEFISICKNPNINNINDIPKEHFIYACFVYFSNNNILDEYNLPNHVIKNYQGIADFTAIDLQAINMYLETKDTLHKKINIEKSLREKILDGLPLDATPLEKAIYIYIKMCKILTYDEEYYAVNQKGNPTLKHQDINFISQITPENNEVVCYEFNLILAKFLSELGVNFQCDYDTFIGEAYGYGHANLEFRYDKFLVKADSVTSILQGDLVFAKLNHSLIGLWCTNKNEDTKAQFNEYVDKMYNLIISQSNQKEDINSFEELIKQYETATENISPVSFDDKISVLISKVNTINLFPIDALSYILQLRKIIFNQEERLNNVSFNIIRNNQANKNKTAVPCLVIVLNNNDFDLQPTANQYYFYQAGHQVVPISLEDLQNGFRKGILEYIDPEDPKIPGLVQYEALSQNASLR